MHKQAIVIGGTRRVGRWCSSASMSAGYLVHAVFRHDVAAAEQLAQEARASGWHLRLHQADARASSELERVVADCQAGGPLDALVVAAGPAVTGPLLAMSPQTASDVWAGNMLVVHSAVLACHGVLKQPGGRIVAFLSAGADTARAFRQVPWYAATKAMLASYLRSLARELAPQGITVNAISLGITELPADGAPSVAASDLPTGRSVTAQDVTAALLYLLSPEADQVTGGVTQLTGGFGL